MQTSSTTHRRLSRADLIQHLRDLKACDEALEWVKQTHGEPKDLWAACQRPGWMLWLLDAVAYGAGTIRHIFCDIAESTLHIYEQAYPDDPRPRNCIAVTRRYADGEATDDELLAACSAAKEAARAASDAAAKNAAWVAAWVATCAPAWDPDPARHADMIRARVSWADVERALELFRAQGGGAEKG